MLLPKKVVLKEIKRMSTVMTVFFDFFLWGHATFCLLFLFCIYKVNCIQIICDLMTNMNPHFVKCIARAL